MAATVNPLLLLVVTHWHSQTAHRVGPFRWFGFLFNLILAIHVSCPDSDDKSFYGTLWDFVFCPNGTTFSAKSKILQHYISWLLYIFLAGFANEWFLKNQIREINGFLTTVYVLTETSDLRFMFNCSIITNRIIFCLKNILKHKHGLCCQFLTNLS